jgi:hypothetical protein
MRGYEKSSGDFSLVCAVHNFKKIVKAILGGKVCLELEGLAPMVGYEGRLALYFAKKIAFQGMVFFHFRINPLVRLSSPIFQRPNFL